MTLFQNMGAAGRFALLQSVSTIKQEHQVINDPYRAPSVSTNNQLNLLTQKGEKIFKGSNSMS